jgi:predicted metal-dependent phosphoesterase TrpH
LSPLLTNLTLAPESAIDLHMHTTYSDGKWPARQLIDYLADEHFDLVAVTDHDRVDKIAEIQELGASKNLPVLSGVEMSTEWNGRMGDLLCYGFSVEHNELSAMTEKIVRLRTENTYEIYENLLRKGYAFPRLEEIFAANNGKMTYPYENGVLLREHGYAQDWSSIMRILTEAGYHAIRVNMAETVEAVHRSGGVCLIAHPGRRDPGFTFYAPALLDELRADVSIDGIEVYHPTHNSEMVETYLDYVRRHDLLASTGSDSHSNPGRMPMKHRAEISHRLLERVGIQVR